MQVFGLRGLRLHRLHVVLIARELEVVDQVVLDHDRYVLVKLEQLLQTLCEELPRLVRHGQVVVGEFDWGEILLRCQL